MPTAAQIRSERKWWRKERERAWRNADRALLRRLRQTLRSAKQLRRDRMREVVIACKRARVAARENARALRAQARAALQAAIDAERQASRRSCDRAKAKVRGDAEPAIKGALEALEAERAHQADLRQWGKKKPTPERRRAASALAESDAEVEANLPHDLIGVWRKVRRQIKGSPRRTRTEAFLEWAAEHAGDVLSIQDAQIDEDIRHLVEHEAELRARTEDPRGYRDMTDEELEAVPF